MRVAIIDYGSGNLRSATKAFERAAREAGVAAEIDLTADHAPHYGFGGGVHHCLGHFVARADMSEALPLLARRLKDLRLAGGDEWLPDSGNTGPIRLPIAFTAR